MREVPEWIGKHDDQVIPPRVRLRVFRRFDGRCQCGCGVRISPGDRWDIEHETALCLGGRHAEGNLRPYLADHHAPKTAVDMAAKSKSDALARKHFGIKPSRQHGGYRGPIKSSRSQWLYGKNSPFKKKIDGTVVRRGGNRGR